MAKVPAAFEVLECAAAYRGYFRVDQYRIRFEQYRGGMGEPIEREVFERGHAAVLLPYDPVRDQVVLVEQFRIGALEAPGGPWVLEPVAGIIELGEVAEGVVRREAEEEAGLAVLDLVHIADYLVSPGGTSERHSLYCGRVDAAQAGGIFGLDEEGEDIRTAVFDFDRAMAAATEAPVGVAALLIAMQWLALNRDALRKRWL
jgi:ADP-ribose pyrophosphatase